MFSTCSRQRIYLNFYIGRFPLDIRKNTSRGMGDKGCTTFCGVFEKMHNLAYSNIFTYEILDFTILYACFHSFFYFYYSSLPKSGSKKWIISSTSPRIINHKKGLFVLPCNGKWVDTANTTKPLIMHLCRPLALYF